MPFTNNTTRGTVVYSPPTWECKILANDGSSLSSATLATQSELSIPIGGFERVFGVYTLWYDSDNTNELSYRIANFDNQDTPVVVATTIATQSIASSAEITSGATPSAAGLESTGTFSTDGNGETVGVDVGADTSALWLQVSFNALSTAATKGNLVFQAANITGSASGTHLLAGSHVVYKKF